MILLPTIQKARVVDTLCRTDFVSFIHKTHLTLTPGSSLDMNFHINALAYHLELVRLGEIKRLIINMPPRSLKSLDHSRCRVPGIRAWPRSDQTLDRRQLWLRSGNQTWHRLPSGYERAMVSTCVSTDADFAHQEHGVRGHYHATRLSPGDIDRRAADRTRRRHYHH